NCERKFSILKWICGDRRTRLQVSHLESMAKIHSFYVSNVKKELRLYGKDLGEKDLRFSVLNETVYSEASGDISEEMETSEFGGNSIVEARLTLQDIVDLAHSLFGDNGYNSQEAVTHDVVQQNENMEFIGDDL